MGLGPGIENPAELLRARWGEDVRVVAFVGIPDPVYVEEDDVGFYPREATPPVKRRVRTAADQVVGDCWSPKWNSSRSRVV